MLAELSPLELFELYPSAKIRQRMLDNAASLWHYTPQEDRHHLHAWAQERIQVMLFLGDLLWKNVVTWYLAHTNSDEDSVAAINFVLSLDTTAHDSMLSCPSKDINKELGNKFRRWLRSETCAENLHRIPYVQIPEFCQHVTREFKVFANSIGSQNKLQLKLVNEYYCWEEAETALQLMLVYAKTEQELLPMFHELVAKAVTNFKEHVTPEPNFCYDPLRESARLGMLEYVELTLRQAIERSK
jgi:hypothetical protein